jgi:hypothetical protein
MRTTITTAAIFIILFLKITGGNIHNIQDLTVKKLMLAPRHLRRLRYVRVSETSPH